MAPYIASKNVPALVTPQKNPSWIRFQAIKKALQDMKQANDQPSVPTTSSAGQPGGDETPVTYDSKSTQTTPSLGKVDMTQPKISLMSEDADATDSDDFENYPPFIPGAYPKEPAQLPVHTPVVHEAEFSDLHTPTPAQRPRRLPSLTPCPPGRYPSSSPQRSVQKPVEFSSPYWPDSDTELPSQIFEIKEEDDPFL